MDAKFTNNLEAVNRANKPINVLVNDKLSIIPNYIETDLFEQENREPQEKWCYCKVKRNLFPFNI